MVESLYDFGNPQPTSSPHRNGAQGSCHRAAVGTTLFQFCEETIMAWTTPTLIEICIGLEINGYLPAEF
jgi:coenzyme PQQ precursor peptide PqqA